MYNDFLRIREERHPVRKNPFAIAVTKLVNFYFNMEKLNEKEFQFVTEKKAKNIAFFILTALRIDSEQSLLPLIDRLAWRYLITC